MSKQKDNSQTNNMIPNQQDLNEIFKENFDKYFQEVEKVMPQYLQLLTTLQQGFLDAWKNTVNESIKFQKEYNDKIGIDTNIPKEAANIIYSIAEEYIKSKNIQNQFILSTLDSANNNFTNSKNTFEPFIEINKRVLDFWSSFYSKNAQ